MDRLLPEPDLDDRYLLDGSSADAVLRELARRRNVLTLFGDDALSTVVQAYGAGLLEVALPRIAQDAVHRASLVGVALLDEVKVQLEARPAELVTRQGQLRLILHRPHRMYRIQRRDGFRVRPLSGDPGVCHLRSLGGQLVTVRVIDVSVVGVALAFRADERPPAIGASLGRCHLRLVPDQILPCELTVRRHEREGDRIRVGCRVLPASIAAEQALQRTIMEIELRRAGGGASLTGDAR